MVRRSSTKIGLPPEEAHARNLQGGEIVGRRDGLQTLGVDAPQIVPGDLLENRVVACDGSSFRAAQC